MIDQLKDLYHLDSESTDEQILSKAFEHMKLYKVIKGWFPGDTCDIIQELDNHRKVLFSDRKYPFGIVIVDSTNYVLDGIEGIYNYFEEVKRRHLLISVLCFPDDSWKKTFQGFSNKSLYSIRNVGNYNFAQLIAQNDLWIRLLNRTRKILQPIIFEQNHWDSFYKQIEILFEEKEFKGATITYYNYQQRKRTTMKVFDYNPIDHLKFHFEDRYLSFTK